jgi:dolichol-phosphate mannosyltransferase
LVLPAWNESESIGRAIEQADEALAAIASQYEIVVVDDGSADDTSAKVRELAATLENVRLVRHQVNQGYGAALRSGFAAARHDLVVFTDADCQFDLTELDRLVLLAQRHQVVCGYRIDRQDSPLRCLYSRVYNQLVRCLLPIGVRDVDCALKMFHRGVLDELKPTTDGFLVNAELLTQARFHGYSVVEVGVSHRPRAAGKSTVSASHIPIVLASLLRYWWNEVQFPASASVARDAQQARSVEVIPDRNVAWLAGLLLLVAAALLLTGLSYPLIDRDETRYAEIPREMLVTGDWILPRLNFEPYYDKPVLLYWLCAASYSLCGISEWSARLVPAVLGMGTLLSTMYFGSRMFGRSTGLLAGVVLLLSAGFLAGSRFLLIDGVLTFFTTLSLFAAYEAIRGPSLRYKWWMVAALACGAAFLAKGPIALVLLVPPVFAFGWLSDTASAPKWQHWLLLAALVAAVVAPWFLLVSLRDPNFSYEFFYKHNVSRFAGAYHIRPFWYFVPVVMIGGHPWTFLTVPYARFLLSRSAECRGRRTRPLGFLLWWSLWCFAFFSASRCKLPTYMLPAAPALALMIGHYLCHGVFSSVQNASLLFARLGAPWLTAATTCLAGAGFAGFALAQGLETPFLAWGGMVLCGLLLLTVILLGRTCQSSRVGWSVSVTYALLVATVVLHREIPRFAAAQTIFGAGSPLLTMAPEALEGPLITIAGEWAGVAFDLNRNDVAHLDHPAAVTLLEELSRNDQTLLVLPQDMDLAALGGQLPNRIRLTPVGRRGPARLVRATVSTGHQTAARPEPPDSPDRR